ncbi:MAG: diaminobutyrate acetyltransferase [Oceanococcus sp.]
MLEDGKPSGCDAIQLRPPRAEDGANLHKLVARCTPLDENSLYCNLLQASHFSDTAVAAEQNGELLGFVSGYRIPARPDTFFLWQVAVDEQGRGQGLARRMIQHILSRTQNADLRFLETTITPDNEASWALFRSFAAAINADLNHQLHFSREQHFDGQHADEHLLRIGPFKIS